ncbi:MAG TPA: hypothetical protein VMY36_03555 [Patescibacteria group bacterium]|nr:hypothetical protein [Patescibacteria group bacterium]
MGSERDLILRGQAVDNLTVGVAQKTIGEYFPPQPLKNLTVLDELNEDLGLTLSVELLPRRFTSVPESRHSSIVGIHGPLEGNFRGVWHEVFDGVPKSTKDRIITAGVAFVVGTEVGPFSFCYRGREIAQELDVYYNLHPDVLNRLSEREIRSYVGQGRILIENGWYDEKLALSHDSQAIEDFKEYYGLGATLDTAHAFQAASASGIERVDLYLREMWEKLKPTVVHFSDRSETKGDHCPVYGGQYTGLLAELTEEMKKKAGMIVILEIDPKKHPFGRKEVIQDSLDFLDNPRPPRGQS